jgi:hypothetical protein
MKTEEMQHRRPKQWEEKGKMISKQNGRVVGEIILRRRDDGSAASIGRSQFARRVISDCGRLANGRVNMTELVQFPSAARSMWARHGCAAGDTLSTVAAICASSGAYSSGAASRCGNVAPRQSRADTARRRVSAWR